MTRDTALIALALATIPALASAQRALVLAPRIEPVLSEAQRAEAAQALEAALTAAGIEPVHGDAVAACEDDACAQRQRAAVGADQAIQLTVWRREGGGDAAIGGVSVGILDASGNRFSYGERVSATDPALAPSVTTAARHALERLRRGPGPWLELSGPVEGSVTIDGREAGTMPGRFRVAGGLHHVVVERPGFAPFDATVTVPRNVDALKAVTVELQPSSGAGSSDRVANSGPRSTRSPWNYAIGGAAAALGVALSIGPVRSSLDDGECGRIEGDRCTGVVRFDALQAVQLGAAVLLVAGGATVAFWGPIRVRMDSSSAVIEARTNWY